MQSYCYALAGVQIVPPSRKVEPDVALLLFMIFFFAYYAFSLWRATKDSENSVRRKPNDD
jgi:hypothetical protein